MTRQLLTAFVTLAMAAGAQAADGAHAHGEGQAHGQAHAHGATQAQTQASAYGQAGDPAKADRTIALTMGDDMRFRPATITVRRGETVRLRVRNEGAMLHEMVLGTPEELTAHAEMMRKSPGMAHGEGHGAGNGVQVKPGATGEIVWRFTRPGRFQYACLVPGHLEAGMVGAVVVR